MKPPQSPFEILLAEDNSGDAMLVREVLDRHEIPCNLRVVTDGAEAISLIEQIDHEPQPRLDLLLMDMHLPKYDGPAILERLRESRHLSNTPVIVLSGLTATQLHARTINFGLVHHFTKPADFQEFTKLGVLVRSLLTPNRPARSEGLPAKAQGSTA